MRSVLVALSLLTATSVRAIPPEPPLHVAIVDGDLAKVKALLAAKASPNERCGDGRTALLEAARWGRPMSADVVLALLAAGADPNVRNEGATVLAGALSALTQGSPRAAEVIEALLAKGASPFEPVSDARYYRERAYGRLRRDLKGRVTLPEGLDRVFSALAAAERRGQETFEATLSPEVEADAVVWRGTNDARKGSELLADADAELDKRSATRATTLQTGLAKDFPRLVKSDAVTGMKPGYFVVVLGFCAPADVAAPLQALKRMTDASIYTRRVTVPKALLSSCPAPAVVPTHEPLVVKSKTQVLTAVSFGEEGDDNVLVLLRQATGELVDLVVFDEGDEACSLEVATKGTSLVVSRSCQPRFSESEMCNYGPLEQTAVFGFGPDALKQRGTLGGPRTPSSCAE